MARPYVHHLVPTFTEAVSPPPTVAQAQVLDEPTIRLRKQLIPTPEPYCRESRHAVRSRRRRDRRRHLVLGAISAALFCGLLREVSHQQALGPDTRVVGTPHPSSYLHDVVPSSSAPLRGGGTATATLPQASATSVVPSATARSPHPPGAAQPAGEVPEPSASVRLASNRIEALSAEGAVAAPGGGVDVSASSLLRYRLDFGRVAKRQLIATLRYESFKGSSALVSIRIGSPAASPAGTFSVGDSDGATWHSVPATIAPTRGIQDLYFTYSGGGELILDWFQVL
ncbi:carbohydrate-binding protein [Streptomyces chartreusis]